MDERDAYLALNLIPLLGPRRIQTLVARCGSAAAVWRSPAQRLIGAARITPEIAQCVVAARAQVDVAAELALAHRHGIAIITRADENYPASLATIVDPPPVLYMRGALRSQDAVAVAIVGSRYASPYGVTTAERLAGELAARGVAIISGLARGIDAAAHRGALRAGGRTLAVLGSGLLRLYPEEHEALAQQIAASGAVISEFPLDTPPLRQHFPRRNRLISGLALGVIVVEAAQRSGALITADLALEQGREVFAVPGTVDALTSRGTNALLRDGARWASSAEDVLEALAVETATPSTMVSPSAQAVAAPPLADEESQLFDRLSDEPQSIDELATACTWPTARALVALTNLELKRLVKRLPGQRYMRVETCRSR